MDKIKKHHTYAHYSYIDEKDKRTTLKAENNDT